MEKPTDEQMQQALELAMSNMTRNYVPVRDAIDKSGSAALKRVLKAITYVRTTEEILGQAVQPLNEEEQSLVDKVFRLQEDVIGYIQLAQELNPPEEPSVREDVSSSSLSSEDAKSLNDEGVKSFEDNSNEEVTKGSEASVEGEDTNE